MMYKVLLALLGATQAIKLNYPAEHQIDTSPYDPNSNGVTGFRVVKPKDNDVHTQDMIGYLQQNGWWIGDWQIPVDDTTTQKLTINRDGTFSQDGKPDGHVWLRLADGTLDLRTEGTKTGLLWNRQNWIEATVKAGDQALLATRLHNHRATNGDIPGAQQGMRMKETDRYQEQLRDQSTFIGEWKGDANAGKAFRVLADGHFAVWSPNIPGLYSEELRHTNVWHGDVWVDMANSEVDFAGKADDVNFHRIGPYRFGSPDRVDFTNSDGGSTFVERTSDYNAKFSTNGH